TANYMNAGIQRTTANILDNFSSGAAPSAPAVTLSATSLSFASQAVGTSSGSQSVTVTNSGSAPLTISSVTVGGTNPADFTPGNGCQLSPSTIAVGANCTVSATFAPTAAG